MDVEWGRAVTVLQQCAAAGDVNSADAYKALDTIVTTLKALRSGRTSAASATALQALTPLPLEDVLAFLGADDTEALDMACEVVRLLVVVLPFDTIVSRYKDYAVTGLKHPYEGVRDLALSVFEAGLDDGGRSLEMMVASGLFAVVVQSLADESTLVSSRAADLLFKACSYPSGLAVLLQPEIAQLLLFLKQQDTTVQFRVLSLGVRIAQQSPSASSQVEHVTGLLPSLVDFPLEDILVFLNATELATQMLKMSGGLSYLKHQGVLQLLLSVLNFAATEQLPGGPNDTALAMTAPFVTSGIAKFIGEMSLADFLDVLKDAPLLDLLVNLLQKSNNPEVQIAAVGALGSIGTTAPGLKLLRSATNDASTMSPWAAMLFTYTHTSPVSAELRAACQQAITAILTKADASVGDALFLETCTAYDAVAASWPTYMSSGVRTSTKLDYLVAIVSDQNEDARWASYGLLRGLASTAWGRRRMILSSGLVTHLLSREKESEKMGIDLKFDVVRTLSSLRNDTIVDANVQSNVAFYLPRIEQYVREGPFMRGATAEVAGMVL